LNEVSISGLSPFDKYNQILAHNTHPADWINPTPRGRYNLIVAGAGTAGLVAASGAAQLGARVALIEKSLLGGDCLNWGCVPSKALIRCARAAHDVRDLEQFGLRGTGETNVDFAAVMERMRRLRSLISFHDSAKRFSDMGVDVFLGEARFSGEQSIRVGEAELIFSKALIATGARPAAPKIDGLSEAGYQTNETVFSLTYLPARFAVIGGGPLGCELAQTFRRLGSEVFIFHRPAHLLEREDEDAAGIIQERFIQEGIRLLLHTSPRKVNRTGGGKQIFFDGRAGGEESIVVDEILVGAGRTPNVDGLDLENAGVEYDSRSGVKVDDHLRTTNPRIYAAGDVCIPYKFTHTAEATAKIALKNSLFNGRARLSDLVIPRVTYTDPEIAHVGMSERDAKAKGIPIDTFLKPLAQVDRAVLDGETEGFAKILVKRGTGSIVGATIVSRHAGEMITEVTLAIGRRLGLSTLSNTIHPYPTQAEAIKGAADLYNRSRIVPLLRKILSLWMAIRRCGAVCALGDFMNRAKRL